MVYRGHVRSAVVVLENAAGLADGTVVRVEPGPQPLNGDTKSIFERLDELAGAVKGLPSDLARNHDYYLHRHPRK